MADFSFKDILWRLTFRVNLLRAVIAGIILVIIFFIGNVRPQPGIPIVWFYALTLLLWPLIYFLVYLPIGLIAGWLGRIGIPFAGLITFLPALMVIPADPIMFVIHKLKPQLVPIKKYRLIEPCIFIWIYEEKLG